MQGDVWHAANIMSYSNTTRETDMRFNSKCHLRWATATVTCYYMYPFRRFLVYTGAHVSVIPVTWINKRAGSTCQPIQAANCTPILTSGASSVPLHFGGRRYSTRLIQADVKRPFLGADFLRQHNLLVDIRGQRLVEAGTDLSVAGGINASPVNQLALIDTSSNQFSKPLAEYWNLLRPTFTEASVRHGVHHFITTGPHVYDKARRLSPDKLTIAKHEFDKME